VLDIDGSPLGYLSAEIAIHHAQGQVDAAGLSSGGGDLLVLDESNSPSDVDVRKVLGEAVVKLVMYRGGFPSQSSAFARCLTPVQTDIVTSAVGAILRSHSCICSDPRCAPMTATRHAGAFAKV